MTLHLVTLFACLPAFMGAAPTRAVLTGRTLALPEVRRRFVCKAGVRTFTFSTMSLARSP